MIHSNAKPGRILVIRLSSLGDVVLTTPLLRRLRALPRRYIIDMLTDEEKCVCEMTEKVGADMSTVSKHLSVLKEAGILADEKRGKQVYYSLKVPCVLNFMHCVEEVIQNRINEQIGLLPKK